MCTPRLLYVRVECKDIYNIRTSQVIFNIHSMHIYIRSIFTYVVVQFSVY